MDARDLVKVMELSSCRMLKTVADGVQVSTVQIVSDSNGTLWISVMESTCRIEPSSTDTSHCSRGQSERCLATISSLKVAIRSMGLKAGNGHV